LDATESERARIGSDSTVSAFPAGQEEEAEESYEGSAVPPSGKTIPGRTRRSGRARKGAASPQEDRPQRPNLSVLLHNARQMNTKEVEAMVPVDDLGNWTSLGSMMHEYGKCKMCVAFAQGGPEGCKKGARCRYCHIPHTSTSQPDATSKMDRGVFRRFLHNVRQQIKKDPERVVVDQIEMPANLVAFPYPRAKFLKMMEKYRQEVLSERTGRLGS
jgi:hypothetical protein